MKNDDMKKFISQKLQSTRADMELTQEQMSERLMISSHSYAELEHGKYFCSATTLINFVNNCEIDKDELFSDFKNLLKNTDNIDEAQNEDINDA